MAGFLLSGGQAIAGVVNGENIVENEMSDKGIFEWEDCSTSLGRWAS